MFRTEYLQDSLSAASNILWRKARKTEVRVGQTPAQKSSWALRARRSRAYLLFFSLNRSTALREESSSSIGQNVNILKFLEFQKSRKKVVKGLKIKKNLKLNLMNSLDWENSLMAYLNLNTASLMLKRVKKKRERGKAII